MDVTDVFMKSTDFTNALTLLGEILENSGSSPQWLIVCGGAALQAQRVIHRATKDVDVFATRSEFEGIAPAYPFPPSLKAAIQQVADLYKLPANWLNASVTFHQLEFQDYPSDFWSDQETEDYGSHLKLSYISPKGLILLKTLALLQREEARDLEDIIALNPDLTTMKEVLDWCISKAVSPQDSAVESKAKQLLTTLNHESLISNYFGN